jgi:hypothetical protein
MMITLHRRALRFSRIHAIRRTSRNGILVVEHEFEGGPFGGRRMTGLACTDDMHVVGFDADSGPRLVARAASTARLGTYRFERAYDCVRTVERVHVYRWHPSNATDES